MALRVACPNGCRLQVPKSRAGTMLRCPKCKKIIKLAELNEATKSEDGMDVIEAVFPSREELVKLKETVKQAAGRSNLVRKTSTSLQVANMQTEQAATDEAIFLAAAVAPAGPPKSRSTAPEAHLDEVMFIEPSKTSAESPGEPQQRSSSKPHPQARWRMPEEQGERRRVADAAKPQPRKPPVSEPARSPVSPSAEIVEAVAVEPAPQVNDHAAANSKKPANSGLAETATVDRHADEETGIKTVGVTHNRDAKSRAVFLTFALVLIGAFAIIPAISSFMSYVNSGGQTEIPRWAAWLVFLGALHLFYAVYVGQLADWTSFRIVSLMMLILTAVVATLLAGMALGGQGGLIARVFQVPLSLTTKAEIWLLTMLSITSLIGYLSGREAFRWKRIENQLRAAISPRD